MGLHVSHGCFRAAYSAFFRFRCEVAVALGYPGCSEEHMHAARYAYAAGVGLSEEDVRNYLSNQPFLTAAEVEKTIALTKEYVADMGRMEQDDPVLYAFFCHSDCDGTIEPKDQLPLAEVLEKASHHLSDVSNGHLTEGSYGAALRFAEGLRRAYEAGEVVVFR